MAVGDFLKPQRSPLSVYDEQMAQLLRQQSAGIGPQAIAQESALGFPVGTMTAKILGNVLAGAKEKRAINRDEQQKRARTLLARIAAGDLPEDVVMDDSGNFSTIIKDAQRIEQPPEELQQPTYGRGLEGQMAGVPAQVIPEVTEEGMMLEGSAEDPNLLERTFFGDVEGKSIEDKYDLIEEAGYDTNQYLRQERQDALLEKERKLAEKDRERIIKIEDDRIEREIKDQNIRNQNILLDIDAKKLNNKIQKETYKYEIAKNENDILSMKAASKKINDIRDIEEQISAKKFADGKQGIFEKELFRANKLSSLGYGDDALTIYKNLKDVGFIDTLSKKEQRESFKDFNKVEQDNIAHITKSVDLYKKLVKAAKEPGGVSKYTLMISYIKQLDDSVVREGEVRSFSSMQGLIDNIEIEYEKIKGQNFPDHIVHQMLTQAYDRVEGAINDYNNNKTDRIETYDELGLNPKQIYSGLERLDMTGLVLPSLSDKKMNWDGNYQQLPNIYSIRESINNDDVNQNDKKVIKAEDLLNKNNTVQNNMQPININRPPPNIFMQPNQIYNNILKPKKEEEEESILMIE